MKSVENKIARDYTQMRSINNDIIAYSSSPLAPKRKVNRRSMRNTTAPIIEIAPVAQVKSMRVVFGGQ